MDDYTVCSCDDFNLSDDAELIFRNGKYNVYRNKRSGELLVLRNSQVELKNVSDVQVIDYFEEKAKHVQEKKRVTRYSRNQGDFCRERELVES